MANRGRPPAITWGFAVDLEPPDYEPLRDAMALARLDAGAAAVVPRELIVASGDAALAMICRGIFDTHNGPDEMTRPPARVRVAGVMGHRREVSVTVTWPSS